MYRYFYDSDASPNSNLVLFTVALGVPFVIGAYHAEMDGNRVNFAIIILIVYVLASCFEFVMKNLLYRKTRHLDDPGHYTAIILGADEWFGRKKRRTTISTREKKVKGRNRRAEALAL